MTAQVAADLRAAADVLERDGWVQRTWEWEGARCAASALGAVVYGAEDDGGDDEMNLRYSAAITALKARVGIAVTVWNDEAGRTAAEVIDALRAAADRAEAES